MISDAQLNRIENEGSGRIIMNYEEPVTSGPGEDEGKTYRGQWKYSKGKLVRDGVGTMTWPDGSVYKG